MKKHTFLILIMATSTPFQPADWIREEDRDAVVLTQAYYTKPLQFYNGWDLISQSKRVGVYRKGKSYIVVCKGTTPTDAKDLFDDLVIGNILEGTVTLEAEARNAVQKLPKDSEITMTGHSLGGRAAMTVAKKFDTNAVVFNPAGPPNSMLTDGPGPKKGRIYQISGDMISNNVSSEAAEVIRVNQGYNPLQTIEAHTMTNFSNSKETQGFYSEKQQDVFVNTSLSYGVALTAEHEIFKNFSPILKAMKYMPYLSNVELLPEDRVDTMQVEGAPHVFVTRSDDPTNTKMVTNKKIMNSISTMTDLAAQVSKLNFYSSKSSLDTVQRAREDTFEAASSVLGYIYNPKLADITLTNTDTENSDIRDKAKLQSLGITDDVFSYIAFSKKVQDPEKYLGDASDNQKIPNEELRSLHDTRFLATPTTTDISTDLPLRGGVRDGGSYTPQSQIGGVAKSLLAKLAEVSSFSSEVLESVESKDFVSSTKSLLNSDAFTLMMNPLFL